MLCKPIALFQHIPIEQSPRCSAIAVYKRMHEGQHEMDADFFRAPSSPCFADIILDRRKVRQSFFSQRFLIGIEREQAEETQTIRQIFSCNKKRTGKSYHIGRPELSYRAPGAIIRTAQSYALREPHVWCGRKGSMIRLSGRPDGGVSGHGTRNMENGGSKKMGR